MNGVQTRFKCKLDVKRCKRFVFPPSSLLPRSNALKTKAIRYFQTDRTLTRIVSPPLVGDPNQYTDLDMGPLIDANALKSVEEKVKKAIEQGAELLCGGHRIGTKGYFFEPTILTNCTQKMDIIQEETFGPVLPVVEFTEVEDAIAWANDCEYGLTSSIYTQNLDMTFKLIRALKFGET